MTTQTFVFEDRNGVKVPLQFTVNSDGSYSINVAGISGGSGGGTSESASDTVWVDPNGGSPLYYIRREVDNGSGTFTLTWLNINGTTATPTIANLSPFNLLSQAVSSVDLGVKADTSASSDTGTFSLIALFKRSLTYLATIATNSGTQSTASNQTTANTSLASIATNTTGVATASNQTTANTSLSTIATNTTGVATAANQVTANSSLSTIATNTTGTQTALAQLHTDLIAPLPAGTNAVGSVIANAGTNLNTSALALETGGNLATVATAQGASGTGITQPTGGSGVLGWLSGIFNKLPASLGSKVSSLALAAVLASDQAEIPVNMSPPQLLSQPSSLALAALNATVQWQVEGGVSYYLSLTNPAAATSQFSGTVTFQYSLDGSTWNSINAFPLAGPTSAFVSTATAVGLWMIAAPSGATVYFRANMTAYTSGTVNALLTSVGQPSAVVALPWNYTVTSGQTVIGPIDITGMSEIAIQISAVTTTVLTAQGTNDPSQTTWDTIAVQEVKSQTAGALTITAAGTYRMSVAGYKWFRLQCTTTGTVLTVQGACARLGSPLGVSAYGGSINAVIASGTVTTVTTVTTVATVTSLSQIAASVPLMSIANGSTNKALGVSMASAVTQADVSAVAFAGSGSVLGTVIASAQAGGAVVSAEINVSALTLGTASAVYMILQESRGGTNFSDIWTSDPFTATGIQSMPAIPVAGRRRWRAFNVGGTSTTVTVTVTTLELPPGSYPLQRQARDAYAATNPLASMFNTVALTASTFVLGTLNSATTPMYVEGTKVVTAFMLLAGGPTVTTQPVVTMQGSIDGVNWATISGATMTAAGNGLYAVTVANTAFKFMRGQVTTAAAYSSGSYTITNMGLQAVN